ncbi:unnamed protein product [Mytilus edulis]|uniref:DZIP3-like HEPN domain-containing protein n=1 Tax=Mytilus edulis TaxID=6550 RepID=A0A8S3RR84_MYTED|nr:unnamed protein product [Mytilus edulis]
MVCLFRNLTKIAIQDQLPRPSDLSEGAAVSRIKFYRNQIAHSDSGAMSDSEFSKTFDEVSMAIEVICPSMKTDCETLKLAHIDHSVHDIYLEFVKNEKQMEEMKQQQEELVAQVKILNFERQNRESIQTEEISDWKKKLETFYVTEAVNRLIKVVKDKQCTIITGVPGSGKSAIAYHVAIYMQETEGYTVVPIWIPSELIKLANSNSKQLFVFDDVFGKYSLNEFNLNCWESEIRHIKMLLNNNILKVLITCRSYLYDQVIYSLSSQSFEQFNLQSDEMSLSLAERKEIIQFIENEIENLKRRKDVSFLALSLLVLSNNSIEKEGLQIGKDTYASLLQDLCDEMAMDTRKSPSKTSILTSLQNLTNMYLDETESIFCTKHDKIFDIISHTIGNFIIRCVLRHGESTFISSRCQMNSLNEQHGDSTIMITDELQTMYFERILKDIERGHTWEVFASIQMKFEKFRVLFMLYLEKSSVNFSFSDTNGTTALHVTAAKGYFDMSKYLLGKNRKLIFSLDSRKNSPLHIASSYGHHEIANLFLSNDAEVDIVNSNECTPLLNSSLSGHVHFTEVLLEHHADVNRCTASHSWSALHFAADDGNIDLIKLLVRYKAIVNSQKMNGMTPLYIACNSGHFNAVQLLIENKADVNKCENEGWSPIHIACYDGLYDIAEILIINSADVNKDNNTGETPLHYACDGNHINIVKLLLQHGSDIDKGNGNEETPLHRTCQAGYVDIVKLLCEHGASTNQRSRDGFTPLHCFCNRDYDKKFDQTITKSAFLHNVNESGDMHLIPAENSDKDIIKHLIKHGADTNSATDNGKTPIILACQRENLEVVKMLLRFDVDATKYDNNGFSPLHIASSEGNVDIVNSLLKHGVAIDHCNVNGDTPLNLACFHGNKNIVEILIKDGADIHKGEDIGNSALLDACNNRHNEIATLLLDNGAEVNSPEEDGRTSLISAAEDGNIDLIKILMDHDADVNFQMNNGMSPIYFACDCGHLEAVQMLLSYHADINKCESTGWSPFTCCCVRQPYGNSKSPLQCACQADNEDIVKLLLNHDASINHCDEDGCTPFHDACSKGNINIVELLLKDEAAVNLPDRTGRTPLYIACQQKCKDVVELLLKHGIEVDKAAQDESQEGWTPLHVSASSGDTCITDLLLKNNATVNVEDRNGHTPLYYATQQKCDAIIELLSVHGAILSNNDVKVLSLSKEQNKKNRCKMQ